MTSCFKRLPLVALVAASVALASLSACAPSTTLPPLEVSDPFALAADGVTVSLSYDVGSGRFVGQQSHGFTDLDPVLMPVAPTEYTLTLQVTGATVTGAVTAPASLAIDEPAASVTLSDAGGSSVALAIPIGSSPSWTLTRDASGRYSVVGTAELSVTVADPTTLVSLVQILTTGGDNTIDVVLGGSVPALPSVDSLVLEFGPGSEIFRFNP